MNIHIQVSAQVPAFSSFGDIPRSGIAGPCDNSVSLLEELPNSFPQWLHYLHFHQQCTMVPKSLHLLQHLLFSFFIFVFLLFRAAPTAYESSQARGQIEATAPGVHHSHSNTGSELHL